MTTNKPKQVGWCAANGEILSISGKKRWLDLGEKLRTRAHCFDEPLIRLSDYESRMAVLFDGYAVYSAMADKGKQHTSPESVAAVLDAVMKLMREVADDNQ